MMSEQPDDKTAEIAGQSSWREAMGLVTYFKDIRFIPIALLIIGIGAALAETVGISLAVMFLFAILGQTDQIQEAGGLLSELYAMIKGIFGEDPFLIAGVFFSLILLTAALTYLYELLTAGAMNRVAERARDLLHRQFVTVGYRYLQKKEHGELIHALGNQSWEVADAFFSTARIGVNLCTVAVFGAGVFALSWIIGLTTLACAVLLFMFLRLLSRIV